MIYGMIMPIAEELLFRGVVFTRIRKYWKSLIAIPASALLFGFYHGNIEQALYGFLMGCMMAYFFWLSNDLLESVILHSAANVIVFTITFNRYVEMHINKPLNCFIFAIISLATWYNLSKHEIS
ncbi:MAG: CPBP family intramembrane metalloprotease [Lachnospiraceae bacterium]|nr:CPBP family intramembrane metalloprotease [Lachnospiraceae bacterium]MDD3659711.1 CPBP family intramembrane metalloprotease [Lachnospiraceae bacterium]